MVQADDCRKRISEQGDQWCFRFRGTYSELTIPVLSIGPIFLAWILSRLILLKRSYLQGVCGLLIPNCPLRKSVRNTKAYVSRDDTHLGLPASLVSARNYLS